MRLALLVLVAGCAAPSPLPPPIANASTPAVEPRSRIRALADQVYAALGRGDVEGLYALADHDDRCRGVEPQRYYGDAVLAARDKTIDVRDIALAGTQTGTDDCGVRVTRRLYTVTVDARQGRNPAYRSQVRLYTLEVGGQLYLARPPGNVEAVADEIVVENLTKLADRMCACIDRTCAAEVIAGKARLARTLHLLAELGAIADPDLEHRKSLQVVLRYDRCLASI